jgi:hypothetical protein
VNSDLKSRLYRANSWITRASSQRYQADPDGRFIFYWIALSALYGQAQYLDDAPAADWQDLHNFIGRVCAIDADGALLASLSRLQGNELERLMDNQFLYRDYWRDGFTNQLADRIANTGKLNKGRLSWYLIEVFDRIRILRHQIFHGCAKDGSGANRESIDAAVTVLEAVVPVIYDVMSREGAGEDWGPLSFPAKGRPGHPDDRRTR